MLTEEACPQGAADELRPTLSRAAQVQDLINRTNAHEAEGVAIAVEMERLSLTKADVKKIQATQKTLAALMGGGLVPEGASL